MVAVAPVAPVAVAVVMDVKEACGREGTGGGEEGGNVVGWWVTSSAGGRAGGQAGGRAGGREGGGWIRQHSKDSLFHTHSNALTVIEVPALVVVGVAQP
jgi:hypothetical protein